MNQSKPAAHEGGGTVIDAVRNWWSQHPLRVAGLLTAEAAKALVRPLAQRHPIALVAGALVVGGLLVWARPWRGILKPALFAGLLPQLMSKALAQLPVESWLAVLSSLVQQPVPHATPNTAAQPEPPANPAAEATTAAQAPLH